LSATRSARFLAGNFDSHVLQRDLLAMRVVHVILEQVDKSGY
jgi:hypothetical protein